MNLFGKYKAPQYLLDSWNASPTRIKDPERFLYQSWYAIVASGGSLWKHTKSRAKRKTWTDEFGQYRDEEVQIPMFSKKENHHFLNCPIKNVTAREAIIYAIAVQHSTDIGKIIKICRSKFSNMQVGAHGPLEFYTRKLQREVIQFFLENDVTIHEMNDLLDYIYNAVDFSLKGRSIVSLTRDMKNWHWEINRAKKMGHANWSHNAMRIENESFEIPQTPGVTWTMEQIVTSRGLAAEGSAMHHCVYGYQNYCVSGKTAIWSLKKENKKTGYVTGSERAVTIEIDRSTETLVQIRGFANRAAKPEEMSAIRFWAGKYNLSIDRWA
jgi:hypothetical protein